MTAHSTNINQVEKECITEILTLSQNQNKIITKTSQTTITD